MGGSAWPALLALTGLRAVALDCWTDGITRGQCCNAIFGPGGNSHCWDGGDFTFESCCGESYQASDCSAFVTHFSFSVVGAIRTANPGEVWESCARAMDLEGHRCNSVNTTTRSCPECGRLSMYLPQYIQCVRLEQARATPSASCPACSGADRATDGGGAIAIVGGAHYPTLLRPRSEGREFSLLATAFDMTVGHQLISEGRWMQPELDLLKAFLPVGGVAVDAGANIGGVTLPLSRHVGPDGQVHAFEPFRVLHQVLTANCAINGLLSCFTYHNALGNRTEQRSRRMPGLAAVGNPSKSYVVDAVKSELLVHHDSQGRMETVSMVRLDDVLRLERLDVIKIDVESGEYEMLLGAEHTIRKFQPVIYVEDSEADTLGATKTPTAQWLKKAQGYSCHDPRDFDLVLMTSTLCVPQSLQQEVRERIRRIRWSGPPR
mmetsp:Transcript_77384/g.170968  ORF Transcript_77384/g.170968 Transcript_77384/m.170968 type:complete len:434 (+) Transcript_77384:51-1352(+)